MIEREVNTDVYRRTRRRLQILEGNLSQRDVECHFSLIGVAHEGIPEKEVRDRVKKADVVTLELTRGVVRAGLSGAESQLLKKSVFWRTLIGDLREQGDQRARGISVNQTPGIAWKRLSLHYGLPTLAPSQLTFEVQPDNLDELAPILSQDQLRVLKERHWLITDDLHVAAGMIKMSSSAMDSLPDEAKFFPLSFGHGLSLVCFDANQARKDKGFEDYRMTFITPPHPSLIKAFEGVHGVLEKLDFLEDKEVTSLTLNALLSYLLSPPELTHVREMAYFANQSVRNDLKPGQDNVDVAHVGGGAHTVVLVEIFEASLPKRSRIEVIPMYDSRWETMSSLPSFFREFIPHRERMLAVKVAGFEAQVVPELLCQQVEAGIATNIGEFKTRLSIHRARAR